MKDILGSAVFDFLNEELNETLWIENTYGEPEEMPLEHFFRGREDMPEIELYALKHCRGKVLDVGAAAGAHSLLLQEINIKVHALDVSPLLAKTMKKRGVKQILEKDIYALRDGNYQTLLLLMNGIGICQTISGLEKILIHFKRILAKDGQILFDSSDVAYLYENTAKPKDKYYGEIEYRYSYKNQKGDWFSWLYIDFETLRNIAINAGFKSELLAQDEQGHYLCRLTIDVKTQS